MTSLPIQPLASGDIPAFAPAAGPLSPAHLAQIDDATRRGKKLRRAMVVATIDAWLTAIFAGLTALSGLFSIVGLILGLALGVIAWNAFRGASELKQFNPAAPRRLALNQLALAGLLISYAVYSIFTASLSSEFGAAMADPELARMLGPIDQFIHLITILVYGGLIIGTTLAQGLAALYYAGRAKHLHAYRAATPEWILQIQRRA